MKKLLILSVAAATLMVSCTGGSKSTAIKTQTDSLSNAIGTLMGMQLKQTLKDEALNSSIVAAAIEKVMATKDAKDIEGEVTAADNYFRDYMTVVLPAKKAAAEEKFLVEAAKKAGIQKTESGLLYEVIEAGDATMMPIATDTVVANYKGTLIDGTEFDSSYKRGEPTEFPLDRVIKGWTEGLQLIGKGGKIKLTIPSALAYGSQGQLGGEVLIFEVELVDVKKAQ